MSIRKFWTRSISPPAEVAPDDCFETIKVEVNPGFAPSPSSKESGEPVNAPDSGNLGLSFQNLHFHEIRFIETCKALDLVSPDILAPGVLESLLDPASIIDLITSNNEEPPGIYRLRMDYGHWGYALSLKKFTPRKLNRVGLIEVGKKNYQYKFRDRSWIEETRRNHSNFDEIIFLCNGVVTDSLWANCVFYDSQQWYSPEESLLKGTKQSYLLSQKLIKLETIHAENFGNFETIGFINALYDLGDLLFDPSKIEQVYH